MSQYTQTKKKVYKLEPKMVHELSLGRPIHMIHQIPYLGGVIIFLYIIYFINGDEDYIEVSKMLKTPKMTKLTTLWVHHSYIWS
jgi:hypothetical protein